MGLNIGEQIYKQRISLGLSTTELSKLTGIVVSTITRLESGEYKFINQSNFDKLNSILNLTGFENYIHKDTSKELSLLIKSKRQELGLSQSELSKLCGYKDTSTIGKLETGRSSKIYMLTYLRLQEHLNLNDDEFIYFIKEKKKQNNRINVNYKALSKLVIEKRQNLKLNYTELAIKAHLSIKTIRHIEQNIEVHILSIIKLLKYLSFSKEEIALCIDSLEEEYIEYILEDKKIFEKKG